MAASLKLLPRKEFIITLENGDEVNGQFGTWALKRFGDKRNVGLSGIIDSILKEKKNPDGTAVLIEGEKQYDISINDMIDLIVCACEYKARQAGKKFTFDDLQFCKWMDDYTFETKEEGVLAKLYLHSSSLESEEKKSESKEAA